MTRFNKHSDTWIQIKGFCAEERKSLVKELIEGSAHDDKLRGQIQFIDKILKHGDEEPPEKPPQFPVSYT